MTPDDLKMWLSPVASWIRSNKTLEIDLDGKWHYADSAWEQLLACYSDCATGQPPLWTPEGRSSGVLPDTEAEDTGGLFISAPTTKKGKKPILEPEEGQPFGGSAK